MKLIWCEDLDRTFFHPNHSSPTEQYLYSEHVYNNEINDYRHKLDSAIELYSENYAF